MVTRASMSVEQEEERAKAVLLPQLKCHLGLVTRMCNLIWRTIASFDSTNLSDILVPLKVRLELLARLADDLRAAGHLCHMGYSTQACTIVCSIFEVAHTIVFVGNDQGRAEQWDEHDDPVRPFKGVRAMVKDNFNVLGSPDREATYRNEYDVYTQLCWMKHTNPIAQGFRDPHFWATHGTLMHAPDTTDTGVRRSWLALQHGGRLAMLAVSGFAKYDLNDQDGAEVSDELRACAKIERGLNLQAIERWGAERPFQGKW